MLDYRQVADLCAKEFGSPKTSDWIMSNPNDYCRALLHQGFTLDDEPDGWTDDAVKARVEG